MHWVERYTRRRIKHNGACVSTLSARLYIRSFTRPRERERGSTGPDAVDFTQRSTNLVHQYLLSRHGNLELTIIVPAYGATVCVRYEHIGDLVIVNAMLVVSSLQIEKLDRAKSGGRDDQSRICSRFVFVIKRLVRVLAQQDISLIKRS